MSPYDPNSYHKRLRETQKEETWIKNIIKVLGKSREEAEALYKKIKPK